MIQRPNKTSCLFGGLEIVVSIDNKIVIQRLFCTNTSDIHLILNYMYSPLALGEYNDFSTQ